MLLVSAAVVGYILYKKYTTSVTNNPAQSAPTFAQTAAAAAYNPGLIAQNIITPPVTATPPPSQGMQLTFDTIQNM